MGVPVAWRDEKVARNEKVSRDRDMLFFYQKLPLNMLSLALDMVYQRSQEGPIAGKQSLRKVIT